MLRLAYMLHDLLTEHKGGPQPEHIYTHKLPQGETKISVFSTLGTTADSSIPHAATSVTMHVHSSFALIRTKQHTHDT